MHGEICSWAAQSQLSDIFLYLCLISLSCRSPSELETHCSDQGSWSGHSQDLLVLSVSVGVLGGHSHAWLLNLSVRNLNSYPHAFAIELFL